MLQPPPLPSPSSPSPFLSSPSRRASAAAADNHEADADAGPNDDNTCQSCGSTRRRHHRLHHHHHESHRHKRHSVPRGAAAAGAAETAAGGGAGRTGRKSCAWSPRWSPHGRAASLDGTATGGDDESRQRRNKQPDERRQQAKEKERRELPPEAAAASAADPSDIDDKRPTRGEAGGEETEGVTSAAGTHATLLRHRTCPTCGAHRRQSPRGSGVEALVDPDDAAMTRATMPTSTASASETATVRRRRGSDMTDNLAPCLGCDEAWCRVCGGPVSTAETVGDVDSSGGGGGGYRRTSTDPKEGRGYDRQGGRERSTGYAIFAAGVAPRGHVRHFGRWNVAGCPGARYTDPNVGAVVSCLVVACLSCVHKQQNSWRRPKAMHKRGPLQNPTSAWCIYCRSSVAWCYAVKISFVSGLRYPPAYCSFVVRAGVRSNRPGPSCSCNLLLAVSENVLSVRSSAYPPAGMGWGVYHPVPSAGGHRSVLGGTALLRPARRMLACRHPARPSVLRRPWRRVKVSKSVLRRSTSDHFGLRYGSGVYLRKLSTLQDCPRKLLKEVGTHFTYMRYTFDLTHRR